MTKKKTGLILLSFLILWAIEAYGSTGSFEGRIMSGLGSTIVSGLVGVIVGGFVLFNVFLFFYNIFQPSNKLSFGTYDKVIAGLWFMIVIELFRFI